MTQTDVGRVQLKRVNAFQGLMIDADIWRDAHEYHRSQMRLHQLSVHGWGIAHGLDVVLDTSTGGSDTLIVSPGIAIDPVGNFIVLAEPYIHRLDTSKPGPIYLLLQYSEVPSGPMQPANDPFGQPTRIVEAFRIHQRDELANDPRLELCRLTYDPLVGRVKFPKDPANPGPNDLDTRYRVPLTAAIQNGDGAATLPSTLPTNSGWNVEPTVNRPVPNTGGVAPSALGAPGMPSTVATPLNLVVARHAGAGWDAHQTGIQSLIREMGFGGRIAQVIESPLTEVDTADLVYVTGHGRLELGDAETQALGRVLERGGTLIGDGCASGPKGDAGAREFAHSFAELAQSLGHSLEAAERGHPVFISRYLFAIAPAGARAGNVVMTGGRDGAGSHLVYCDADYGCAWAGGTSQQPLQRGAIRDALELGVNLVSLGR